jgi:hypothetical protein
MQRSGREQSATTQGEAQMSEDGRAGCVQVQNSLMESDIKEGRVVCHDPSQHDEGCPEARCSESTVEERVEGAIDNETPWLPGQIIPHPPPASSSGSRWLFYYS